MLETAIESVFEPVSVISSATGKISLSSFLFCTLASLCFGICIALLYRFRREYSRELFAALMLLPPIVQVVIMLVNGNLGTGVAVMGAFSLIRFRSAPGSAREICAIFLAMAVGIAAGVGYLGVAVVFLLIIGGAQLLFAALGLGEAKGLEKELKITIPESLDYSGIFDDLFEKYASGVHLLQVRTTNMGSLYQLKYRILLKKEAEEKEFLDALRCRNGNLEISCGRIPINREEL